jgi:glycosyltransferase involved in cell wall biosynthesis
MVRLVQKAMTLKSSLAKCLFLIAFLGLSLSLFAKTEFVVVIPSFNNAQYCIENLKSLSNQTYPDWTAIYINDCSTDQTGQMVERYVQEHRLQNKIKIFHNKKNKGAMANFYEYINKIAPQKVVVHLDGDDKLAHPGVLDRLAISYSNPDVWMTYGNYKPEPDDYVRVCAPIPDWVMKKNAFRKYDWVASHLRSYYAKLFHKIKKKDLQHKGKFVSVAADVASMMCILEMSSDGHIQFIPEVLYIYNYLTPLNDMKKDSEHVLYIDKKVIRKKKPYKPLKKLF